MPEKDKHTEDLIEKALKGIEETEKRLAESQKQLTELKEDLRKQLERRKIPPLARKE